MLNTILYSILGTVAVCVLIWAVIKYPNARVYVFAMVGTLFGLALIGGTTYSAIQLNIYYTSQGGIFGAITGIFDTNQAVVEDLSFSLNYIELTKATEESNIYSAKVMKNDVVAGLETGESYVVYVNGAPCSATYASDYVNATYEYQFLDENFDEVLYDALSIKFSFEKKATTLVVSTSGGAQAVALWNQYFNKNDFVIEIKIAPYVAGDSKVVPGEFNQDKIKIVTYYVDGEKYTAQCYLTGEALKLPTLEREDFYCWSLTEENWTDISKIENFKVNDNIAIFAILLRENTVKYMSQDILIATETIRTGFSPTYPITPTRTDYTFAGWSLDGLNRIDKDTFIIEKDVTFIALWQVKQITLRINSPAGSSTELLEVHTTTSLIDKQTTIVDYAGTSNNFVEWRVVSGDGVVSGGQFTAGSNDTVIEAVYEKTVVEIVNQLGARLQSFTINYSGNDYTVSKQGSGVISSVILNTEESGSLTINKYVEVENAAVTDNEDGTFTVTWTNQKNVKIYIGANSSGGYA